MDLRHRRCSTKVSSGFSTYIGNAIARRLEKHARNGPASFQCVTVEIQRQYREPVSGSVIRREPGAMPVLRRRLLATQMGPPRREDARAAGAAAGPASGLAGEAVDMLPGGGEDELRQDKQHPDRRSAIARKAVRRAAGKAAGDGAVRRLRGRRHQPTIVHSGALRTSRWRSPAQCGRGRECCCHKRARRNRCRRHSRR